MNRRQYNKAVNELSDKLFGYAMKLSKEREWAKDLVQNSFIKLWENREKVEPKYAKAFLFRVLYNNLIDDVRKAKRIDHPEHLPERETKLDGSLEDRDQITHAFNQLRESEKSIILLRDWEGYNYQEISEILSLSLSQVKVNLFRARKKMRQILNDLEAEVNKVQYGN